MDDYRLLNDPHKQGYRQGPGGDAETEQALNLAMDDRAAPLMVADIGCGTGASAVLLARLLMLTSRQWSSHRTSWTC
jgi:hypothetical protein